MNAQKAIASALKSDLNVWNMLLDDVTDAELLMRPVPGANHLAWQIGHIITAECRFLKNIVKPMPELPANFEQQHGKEMSQADKGFLTKAEYQKLQAAVREATIAALASCTDADLDKPNTGPMEKFAPTYGAVFQLCAAHSTMHVGQLTVLRRKLGKPVKF